jgi:hypothetical protein
MSFSLWNKHYNTMLFLHYQQMVGDYHHPALYSRFTIISILRIKVNHVGGGHYVSSLKLLNSCNLAKEAYITTRVLNLDF